jgi:hypothetical protein
MQLQQDKSTGAKETYKENLNAERGEYLTKKLPSQVLSTLRTASANTRISKSEVSKKPPRNTQRRLQINKIYKMNIPMYHIHISQEEEGRWKKWALGAAEVKSFYALSL